ncbi:uncharacterized protein LOC131612151 isoform X1 [Vicia villosa]|uniref:uncharacterized protein LOC131612151 isoform X1 n=2 Tax=Vicia villosa TaxID=3911 RepID=UPI00273A9853|nr:uncharacterized protein LOC131612151 isoform X1 [Vicia villosa]XP_058739945.1 uncharacterized protein LOC131612151 isoform X1 [Vicia villosa]
MQEDTETMKTVSLKLVVNKETDKVLFAEAGKDFVDILCSFLTIPLGTIARIIQNHTTMEPLTLGSLNSLYKSVENLDLSYLTTNTCKEMLLHPRNSSEDYCDTLKFNIDDAVDPTRPFFVCSDSASCKFKLLSSFSNQRCECGSPLDHQILMEKEKVCNGFVKDCPTFLVTDDLRVLPNSMDTSFDLLKNFGIKNSDSVKTMTAIITQKSQILDLLKYSLLSKSSLTNLFLRNKPFLEGTSFTTCECDIPNNSSIQIKLKLFFRKTDGDILFAQGEEDFADFLVSFLTFPLGGVVRMLGGDSSLGCIDSLYRSITELDENKYMMIDDVKSKLVAPCIAPQFKSSKQILQIYEPPSSLYYSDYQFIDGIRRVTNLTSNLSVYNFLTATKMELVDPKSSNKEAQEGYVKGPSLFMATNDLSLEPMSPTSTISLLNQLETPPSNIIEKVVFIGVKEGLSILKAALTSTSALTNGLGHLLTQAHDKEEDEEDESYWKRNWSRIRTYSIALNCIFIILHLFVIFFAYI